LSPRIDKDVGGLYIPMQNLVLVVKIVQPLDYSLGYFAKDIDTDRPNFLGYVV
jgi:hypothetical protein